MPTRAKPFLKFLAICVPPLLLLGIFNCWNGLRTTKATLRSNLAEGLTNFTDTFNYSLREQEEDLVTLSRSYAIQNFLRKSDEEIAQPAYLVDSSCELRVVLASAVNRRGYFASLSAFRPDRQRVLVARPGSVTGDLLILTKDFLSSEAQPDERVWTLAEPEVLLSGTDLTPEGARLRLSIPVFETGSERRLGVLAAELRIGTMLEDAARSWSAGNGASAPGRTVIVLDGTGRILYHPNHALLHQAVSPTMPYFRDVAARMGSAQNGVGSFSSAGGAESEAAFAPLPAVNIFVAVTADHSQPLARARRSGWITLFALVGLGTLAAALMTRYWDRKRRGIERVKRGVAAIAKGELDHRIDVQSGVDMRPLADDVNLLTAQLREQVVREAEARQFQSFVKLSAMLTHDLKNAIEALSLIVGNMERHFDNQAFRADAMKSLNLATQNLRSLVIRLTNPVTTLSGEHKRPQPVDLIPMLQRVIALTAEPFRGSHQIETNLPASLFALVDAERMEKVMENLVLNALEAMADKSGTLTIAAGKRDQDQVFFRITDTGSGMSRDFIENRLYRPFATTKKRGVGLGLYTCREVVRAHGGSIEVESQEAAGTTFTVVLPSSG